MGLIDEILAWQKAVQDDEEMRQVRTAMGGAMEDLRAEQQGLETAAGQASRGEGPSYSLESVPRARRTVEQIALDRGLYQYAPTTPAGQTAAGFVKTAGTADASQRLGGLGGDRTGLAQQFQTTYETLTQVDPALAAEFLTKLQGQQQMQGAASDLQGQQDRAAMERQAADNADAMNRLRVQTSSAENIAKLNADTRMASGRGSPFNQEQKLAGQFNTLSKDFLSVRDAYNRIKRSADKPTPAGDLSMLYQYMKILDPGSVVRESEFAQAAKTGALPEQIKAAAGRVVNGQRLSDQQRADFLSRAETLYQGQLESQKQLEDQYSELASSYGLEPSRVVKRFALGETNGAPQTAGQATAAASPEDAAAIEWARANKDDPRAQEILRLHGVR